VIEDRVGETEASSVGAPLIRDPFNATGAAMGQRAVKAASLALMALTGVLAALLVPYLFLAEGLTWMHQAGMMPGNWAAQDLWPLWVTTMLALLGTLYLSARALWYVGKGHRCPRLLLLSWTAFTGAAIALQFADDLACRAVMKTHLGYGAWGLTAREVAAMSSISTRSLVVTAIVFAVALLLVLARRGDALNPGMERASDD
jgi:hypothetical protein